MEVDVSEATPPLRRSESRSRGSSPERSMPERPHDPGNSSYDFYKVTIDENGTPRYASTATVANPAYSHPCKETLGTARLQRPRFFPAQLDDRLAPESVYMLLKVAPDTEPNVVYLIPQACGHCRSSERFCNRGQPSCDRCVKDGFQCVIGPPQVLDGDSSTWDDHWGRGKRIKKPRRLSDADEVDPNKRSKSDPPRPASQSRNQLPFNTRHILRPEDVSPTVQDKVYLQGVKENRHKETIPMSGPCPLWGLRREPFIAALGFTEDLSYEATGAAVYCVNGDTQAAGVVLEGRPTLKAFWGVKEDTGTIVAAIGHPRKRYAPDRDNPPPALSAAFDILNGTGRNEELEPPALEKLFAAQRQRTPVIVAVSESYTGIPFRLPRPYMVLGYFWVTDSWTVPAGGPNMVSWLFEFEFCAQKGDGRDVPWWRHDKTTPNGTAYTEMPPGQSLDFGPDITGSATARGRVRPRADHVGLSAELQEMAQAMRQSTLMCPSCKLFSDTVYETVAPCLNERCRDFFKDVRDEFRGQPVDPTGCPGEVITRARVLPSHSAFEALELETSHEYYATCPESKHRVDLWRRWICRACRCANIWCDWFGFVCEGCGKVSRPKRIATVAGDVDPSNDVIVLADAPITRNLGTVRVTLTASSKDADNILLALQSQGEMQVPFARPFLSAESCLPSELRLSPFFTLACGSRPPPTFADVPAGVALSWDDCPPAVMEFASLLSPKSRVESAVLMIGADYEDRIFPVRIPVPPHSSWDISVLGGHAMLDFKVNSEYSEQPFLCKHGQGVHIATDDEGVVVELTCSREHPTFVSTVQLGPEDERQSAPLASPTGATGLVQWYVGELPLDKTNPRRTLPSDRINIDYVTDSLGHSPDTSLIEQPPLEWRGTQLVPAFERIRIDIPVPPPLKDSDDEEDEGNPSSSRRRSRGGRGGRASRGGMGGRGGRPGSGTAASPASATASAPSPHGPRGGGRGRGRAARSRGSTRASAGADVDDGGGDGDGGEAEGGEGDVVMAGVA